MNEKLSFEPTDEEKDKFNHMQGQGNSNHPFIKGAIGVSLAAATLAGVGGCQTPEVNQTSYTDTDTTHEQEHQQYEYIESRGLELEDGCSLELADYPIKVDGHNTFREAAVQLCVKSNIIPSEDVVNKIVSEIKEYNPELEKYGATEPIPGSAATTIVTPAWLGKDFIRLNGAKELNPNKYKNLPEADLLKAIPEGSIGEAKVNKGDNIIDILSSNSVMFVSIKNKYPEFIDGIIAQTKDMNPGCFDGDIWVSDQDSVRFMRLATRYMSDYGVNKENGDSTESTNEQDKQPTQIFKEERGLVSPNGFSIELEERLIGQTGSIESVAIEVCNNSNIIPEGAALDAVEAEIKRLNPGFEDYSNDQIIPNSEAIELLTPSWLGQDFIAKYEARQIVPTTYQEKSEQEMLANIPENKLSGLPVEIGTSIQEVARLSLGVNDIEKDYPELLPGIYREIIDLNPGCFENGKFIFLILKISYGQRYLRQKKFIE